jgi:hypothetical protein
MQHFHYPSSLVFIVINRIYEKFPSSCNKCGEAHVMEKTAYDKTSIRRRNRVLRVYVFIKWTNRQHSGERWLLHSLFEEKEPLRHQ